MQILIEKKYSIKYLLIFISKEEELKEKKWQVQIARNIIQIYLRNAEII